eukprot:TRINITY_DN347_c0_g1_i3.p1 TRINITY_DN347_c0_g1~~TRINITY_DN347_c0_g1_i3.p1  ORF type:complete len:796 (+),score=157.32 TRINITY_DN347_c0_g1_i3:344-2731(+)
MDRKKEAYELVRKGLRYDIKSYVCWNVLALMYRSEKNYFEAAKCYKNALKYSTTKDGQMLRDLALVQIQNRDFKGLVTTRNQLLNLKPDNKANWMAFAIASHLSGDHQKAIQIIKVFESLNESKKEWEDSEMVLYKNMIIEESGDLEGALKHLDEIEHKVLDKLAWREKKAELMLKLKRFEDAQKEIRTLIDTCPDNARYHAQLLESLGIQTTDASATGETLDKLVKIYDELAQKYPKDTAPVRIPLSFLSGDQFITQFKKYCSSALTRGIPSLFQSVKHLYKDKAKAALMLRVFKDFESNLEKFNKLDPEDLEEPPSTILWTWFYLSQHYTQTHQYDTAFEYIIKAIKHTPTVIDLYLERARIHKRAGDLERASEWYDYGRELDLADRFLNTEGTKYLLRADRLEKAEATFSLFIKETTNISTHIYDMQVMWYEYEQGCSYYRQGQYSKALKKLMSVSRHFSDIKDDQFDFHSFCLNRTMALRSYVNMLRYEDRLHSHKYYTRAAIVIVQIYLHLYDQEKAKDDHLKTLTEAEKKAYEKKQQTERQKQENVQKKNQQLKKGQALPKKKKWIEYDSEGFTLINNVDHLAKAHSFSKVLLKYAPNLLKTHLLAFEVFIRKKKYLLALREVKHAIKLAPHDAEVHKIKIRYFHTVRGEIPTLDPIVSGVIKSEESEILGGKDYKVINEEFLKAYPTSYEHRAAAAEMILLYFADKTQALSIFKDITDDGYPLQACINVHKFLLSHYDATVAQQFQDLCTQRFKYCPYFNPNKDNIESTTATTVATSTTAKDDNQTNH